mgnify:CR=1 FL=1
MVSPRRPGSGLSGAVTLREVAPGDIPIFFEHQSDPEANWTAAFAAEQPYDRGAHEAHWTMIRAYPAALAKTVLVDGAVVGHVLHFEQMGLPSVAYWIGREHWGKGIATGALRALLSEVKTRPLYARAAADNTRSLRVLEKCGFKAIARDRSYANARKTEVDEVVLRLDA